MVNAGKDFLVKYIGKEEVTKDDVNFILGTKDYEVEDASIKEKD